ncbi:MAG: hypothetical protein MUF40_02200 [Gemmatimonadaceae bacterium]|nr:hypothetical protein [Gemmatimonadaceae bacterium]
MLDDSPSTAATVDGRPVRDALVAAARRAWALGAEQRLLLTTDGRVHRTPAAVDSRAPPPPAT